MRIFIGNLPHDADENQLKMCFEQFGATSRVVILRDAMRTSRQCGFVDLVHDRDGLLAVEELNGRDWDGRRLRVEVARPRPQRT